MRDFPGAHDYRIHRVYSVHANDRREDVDLVGLMASTELHRELW